MKKKLLRRAAGLIVLVTLTCITVFYLAVQKDAQLAQASHSALQEIVSSKTETAIRSTTPQYIDVTAKDGYAPETLSAPADTPLTLRIKTANTFDCSASLVIPDLKFDQHLPANGTTEVAIPPQPAGTTIKGSCSMGMYSFTLTFG